MTNYSYTLKVTFISSNKLSYFLFEIFNFHKFSSRRRDKSNKIKISRVSPTNQHILL
jgi:hypothetical protein